MGSCDIRRCGWVDVDTWKWTGLLRVVWEEAVPAQISPQVRCRPQLWPKMCNSKFIMSTLGIVSRFSAVRYSCEIGQTHPLC